VSLYHKPSTFVAVTVDFKTPVTPEEVNAAAEALKAAEKLDAEQAVETITIDTRQSVQTTDQPAEVTNEPAHEPTPVDAG
jgi:hypothetical protein